MQVPRTFHNGIKGTFMDVNMHNRYFRDIAYNTNPAISWFDQEKALGYPLYLDAQSATYESKIDALFSKCSHAKNVHDIIDASGSILQFLSSKIDFVPSCSRQCNLRLD
jgi:hypothetical protein